MQPMLWGLVPPWHRGPAPTTHGLSTNNCRVEGVAASKLYSPSLASRRQEMCRGVRGILRVVQAGDWDQAALPCHQTPGRG